MAMTSKTFAIDLQPNELKLVALMKLHPLQLSGADEALRNAELAGQLLDSLRNRNAIPAHRIQWFTDPEFNVGGRGRSKFERFTEQHEDNVPNHPNFLNYLRYFLYGPELPKGLIQEFQEKVEDCGQVTSGDIASLSKTARALVRTHGLTGQQCGEEFYKLALECGIHMMWAQSIRSSVLSVR